MTECAYVSVCVWCLCAHPKLSLYGTDLGTLQRVGRIVGPGVAREMAFSAEAIAAQRAREVGLVNRVFETKEAMLTEVRHTVTHIHTQIRNTVCVARE